MSTDSISFIRNGITDSPLIPPPSHRTLDHENSSPAVWTYIFGRAPVGLLCHGTAPRRYGNTGSILPRAKTQHFPGCYETGRTALRLSEGGFSPEKRSQARAIAFWPLNGEVGRRMEYASNLVFSQISLAAWPTHSMSGEVSVAYLAGRLMTSAP